jgi:hypothetical protein
MSLYDYNPVGWPTNNDYMKNDYVTNILENRQNQNFGMQPHTHNAQGQSIPMAQPINNFQPMGPLGNPGMTGNTTPGTGGIPAVSNPIFKTELDNYNKTINPGINPVPTGGK